MKPFCIIDCCCLDCTCSWLLSLGWVREGLFLSSWFVSLFHIHLKYINFSSCSVICIILGFIFYIYVYAILIIIIFIFLYCVSSVFAFVFFVVSCVLFLNFFYVCAREHFETSPKFSLNLVIRENVKFCTFSGGCSSSLTTLCLQTHLWWRLAVFSPSFSVIFSKSLGKENIGKVWIEKNMSYCTRTYAITFY